jgi:valyl-tRNA synthetase
MNEKLLRPYNPKETEERIYKLWEESGFFNPDICIEKGVTKPDAEVFSIVLPPPNVTGTLHCGHALMLAIEDIMVRYARMRGKRTLWIPGVDHAAIATEAVVVKKLAKEKKTKHDVGREGFLELVNSFARESHNTITSQLKKMGASLDWSREAFTLDEKRRKAVYKAFETMYNDGLIYRGQRVVNWDPKGQTTVSDDEVNHTPQKAKLYYFKYDKNFPITIATTRPETKLGDTAVAVNPEDSRYKEYIGKIFEVNFVGVPLTIKIIADRDVNKEFGTGALGVTPAHSQLDWEMAERHDLKKVQVINEYGKIINTSEEFNGKKTAEAREAIIQKLNESGLLEKEEEVDQNISISQRTGAVIEPLPKLQWFVDVSKKSFKIKSNKLGTKNYAEGTPTNLKTLMYGVVADEKIKIIPENFRHIYSNWLGNLRDWCISRQIWYGHQIPVWYKDGQEPKVSEDSPGEGWIQDPDTLDTWFSSGLWTFSTLGWPEKSEDLKTYHPTTIIETGHDILFFWVARMILMSTYLLGELPFKTVYLHGMVLDKNGKKMSKSHPETAIDPVNIIEKFGTDALRMAMIIGVGPGNNNSLSEEKIRAYTKFANKIWNASRFVLENTNDIDQKLDPKYDEEDEASAQELKSLMQEITKEMEEYKYYLVGEKLYHYFWHTFADIIIERSKKKIVEGRNAESAKALLYFQLTTLLKALHPFMPFVTEELWGIIGKEKLLMVEAWPS